MNPQHNCVPGNFRAPVIKNCPFSTTLSTVETSNTATYNWPPVLALDTRGAQVAVVTTGANAHMFPVGTNTVVITATDSDGNIARCSFDVIVKDTWPPVLSFCSRDLYITPQAPFIRQDSLQRPYLSLSWPAPQASDNDALSWRHTFGSEPTVGNAATTVVPAAWTRRNVTVGTSHRITYEVCPGLNLKITTSSCPSLTGIATHTLRRAMLLGTRSFAHSLWRSLRHTSPISPEALSIGLP